MLMLKPETVEKLEESDARIERAIKEISEFIRRKMVEEYQRGYEDCLTEEAKK
jgi:hypothetical protein